MLSWLAASWEIGRTWSRRRSRRSLVDSILSECERLQQLREAEIRERFHELRWSARCGVPLTELLVPTFAIIRDASRRAIGLSHFPVQLMGGLIMAQGDIAEMRTGEGKTLTSLLPIGLFALAGRGCHAYTTNDYLAERDAVLAEQVLGSLGLSIASIGHQTPAQDRRAAYACDITYGTEKEFGFDFLRDQMRLTESGLTSVPNAPGANGPSPARLHPECVQRERAFALIDEADSIMIDQARTPLLISGPSKHSAARLALYRWSHEMSGRMLADRDYVFDAQQRTARLTDSGCRRLLFESKPVLLDSTSLEALVQQVQLAITARIGFHRDKDYILTQGKVELVDESTGRVLDGRKWQDGLHQAVEFQAGVRISDSTVEMARVTVQQLLTGYEFLAGMTGTAQSVRTELKRIYGCGMELVPTYRPSRLQAWPTRVFRTMDAKLKAMTREIQEMIHQGRAVLVGTPSIRASEAISQILEHEQVDHVILHARHHSQEAEIVAQAGRPGAVTVATNMAGRGTDIKLTEAVRSAGGLHVIVTEMHASARIDRQLIGRAGRQGDPGSYRFFLSLEDELLQTDSAAEIIRNLSRVYPTSLEFPENSLLYYFQRAQHQLERQHAAQRQALTGREQQHRECCERLGLNPYLEQFSDPPK